MLHHALPAGHQLQHSQSQSNYHKSSGADPAPRRQQPQTNATTTHSLSGNGASNNRRSGGGGGGVASTNLRPASSTAGSTQRLSSGSVGGGGGGGGNSVANRDHSVTQFALIDDDNVSALQQMTRGGGALTMASQWKSQFDDSEETTDNEWKQEPQSPSHHCGPASHPHQRHASAGPPAAGKRNGQQHMLGTQSTDLDMAAAAAAAVRKRAHLNIAGIENYEHLQDVLPHCWSEPALGSVLRDKLEPPVLQQAAFDDTVRLHQIYVFHHLYLSNNTCIQIFRMDIVRNVSVRETCITDVDGSTRQADAEPGTDAAIFNAGRESRKAAQRNSLPHIDYKESDFHRSTLTSHTTLGHRGQHQPPRRQYSADPTNPPQVSATLFTPFNALLGEEDCCAPISGRLEIRVVPQDATTDNAAGSVLRMTADPEPVSSGYFEATASDVINHLNGNDDDELLVVADKSAVPIVRRQARSHTPSSNGGGGGGVGNQPGIVVAIAKPDSINTTGTTTTTSSNNSSSKIPVFNQQRILKCASWAGGDCPSSGPTTPEIQDLTPGM